MSHKKEWVSYIFLDITFTDQGIGDAWNKLPAKSGSDCRAG